MEQVNNLRTDIKYKDTPIGKIPVDWEVKRLIDTASYEKYTFTGGPFGSDLKEECYTNHGVRIIQLQNIGDGKFLDDYRIFTSEEKANELKSCNIYPGDIIIAKMADPVARACIIPDTDKRYLMASDGIRLSVNQEDCDTNFVLYAINSTYFRKNAERNSTGTTRLRIGLTEIKNLPIGIPPLKEQKKIAEILTTVDDAIEKTTQIIEKTKEVKKGLMQRLLTRGIGHNKFKKTEIAEIPEAWTTIKLNDVVKLSSGRPRPKDFIPEYGRDSIYPIYGGNGILGYSSKFNFENKTIILGRVGEYCGVVHRNDGKCWISDNALYIKELKYSFFDLQFLALSLEYKDLNRYKSQSGQPLISQRVLYNLQLALPPIDEQKKISAIISEITSMLENEQSHKAELEQIKKGLMQVLLTGKLRVAV